jgi:Zn-dependent protease
MKKLVASVMALSLGTSAAMAGGPVVVEEEVEVEAEKPASSVGILPLLLVGVILCVALCGGDDDDEVLTE